MPTKLPYTSPIAELKDRVAAARKKLPEGTTYKQIEKTIIKHDPDYDTAEGARVMNNVWIGRLAHIHLTEIIEKIAVGTIALEPNEAA